MPHDWVKNIDDTNLLACLDVLDDLIVELNIAAAGRAVEIPLWNQTIKYIELHPGDSIGIRDAYIDRRWKIMAFLRDKRVIDKFTFIEGPHRWQSRLSVKADLATVRKTFDACAIEESERRNAQQSKLPHQPESDVPVEAALHDDRRPSKKQKKKLGLMKWISIISLAVGVLGLIATWLAVPEFHEWLKSVLIHQRALKKK